MAKRILIMGLPGAGKTFLAQALKRYLEQSGKLSHRDIATWKIISPPIKWINADDAHKKYNDWDFLNKGRIRQLIRMRELANNFLNDFVIADFVAPLPEMRHNFKADWTIWVDTIDTGSFKDTNKIFVPPDVYNFRVTEKDAEKWAELIGTHIIENYRCFMFDWQKVLLP